MRVLLTLVLCTAPLVYAQATKFGGTPQVQPAIPPDAMTLAVYEALFRAAMPAYETFANRDEAAGEFDPLQRNRRWLQTLTGLTDAEFAKVRPIALDAIAKIKATTSQIDAISPRGKAQTWPGGAVPSPPPPPPPMPKLSAAERQQIGVLNAQREAMVLDHVKQIQTALGPDRFQVFDAAVRTEIQKSLIVMPLVAPPPKK